MHSLWESLAYAGHLELQPGHQCWQGSWQCMDGAKLLEELSSHYALPSGLHTPCSRAEEIQPHMDLPSLHRAACLLCSVSNCVAYMSLGSTKGQILQKRKGKRHSAVFPQFRDSPHPNTHAQNCLLLDGELERLSAPIPEWSKLMLSLAEDRLHLPGHSMAASPKGSVLQYFRGLWPYQDRVKEPNSYRV